MEINGIAHIALSVNRYEACVPFYEALCSFLEMKQVFKGKNGMYFIGGRTAVAIGRAAKEHLHTKFDQNRVGLHHFCFRARKREDVDALYDFLLKQKARIVHPPEDGPWAPGYYSLLFEDPDGIRLEINYVPGQGVLAEGQQFNPGGHYD